MHPPESSRVLVDPGNMMLAKQPVRLDLGSTQSPMGTLGVLTIRTATTTLTAFLTEEELREWARLVSGLANQIGTALMVAGPMDMAELKALIPPNGGPRTG